MRVPIEWAHLWWVPETDIVELVDIRDGRHPKLPFDCLASFTHYCDAPDNAERLAIVMVCAMQLIIRDGVEPSAVHRELCKIREYHEQFPDDLGVADTPQS